jgi:hypothetical protein
MGAETIMVGSAIFSFILLYMMGKLDNKHWVLKIFLFFFSISGLMVLAQSVSLGAQECEYLVVNSTTTGSTVNYEYEYTCTILSGDPDNTLLGLIFWLFILITIYSFLFVCYMLVMYIRAYMKQKRGKFGR